MQEIVTSYREADQPWPASSRQISAWAIKNDIWRPYPSSIVDQCAKHLSQAMREEHITDPQGRVVRAKHVARVERDGVQMPLWGDIRTADRKHMQIAFQQRRQQVVGDCRQLKTDLDSFNENRNPIEPIQMSFDFTHDLEELEAVINL